MFERIKKWLNKEVSNTPKNIYYEIFDQEKLKFISENLPSSVTEGHFKFKFNQADELGWSDKFKEFSYLRKVCIDSDFISEVIYFKFNYTPGVWNDALKESLENLYQKALVEHQKKISWELERKQTIENLFKKEV